MSQIDSVLVEACVDTARSARRAVAGGARRLELCANLVEGGTTPSAGLMSVVREEILTPIHVLVRPRGGDFLYETDEIATMLADIAEAKRIGMAGVVIGALTPEGRIDEQVTGVLVDAARPMAVTFHRAFDLALGPIDAMETLTRLGIERVLTSGLAATAVEGIPIIREMVGWSAGRVTVMAGGGVDETNALRIVRETGVQEIHLRGSRTEESAMTFHRPGVFMGKRYDPDEYRRSETSEQRIREVVAALR
jgi:copper homeostasis protein